MLGAVAGTAISIGFYAWLGLRGIVPALLLMVAVTIVTVWVLPLWPATVVVSVLCLRGLAQRIGVDHRVVRATFQVRGMRR